MNLSILHLVVNGLLILISSILLYKSSQIFYQLDKVDNEKLIFYDLLFVQIIVFVSMNIQIFNELYNINFN